MNELERQQIKQECRDLIVDCTHYGEHRELEKAAALFAEDGEWLRGGRTFKGRADVMSSYSFWGPTLVVRHINGGTSVRVIDENNAESVTYYVAIRYDAETENPELPLPFEFPFSMGEWHDRFVRTPEGWRFASRRTVRVFERQDPH